MAFFHIILMSVLIFSMQYVQAANLSVKTANTENEYEENLYSLKQLTGVYVVLDYVTNASLKSHLTVNPNLEQDIKKRLESVGLKLLTKDEMLKTAGTPQLDIYPNYPAHLSADSSNSDSEGAIPNLAPTQQHCCYTSVWGSFSQGGSILRKPQEKYRLSTWGNGSNTDSCDRLGEWMSDATLKIIDNFVSDYKKSKEAKQKATTQSKNDTDGELISANTSSEIQYVKVKEADDTKGMTCNTAFMVYAQIFKTGAATITHTKVALLDKLASHMLSCSNHRYRIEIRPDEKGTKEAKDLLSARRAVALNNYLLEKEVDENQFEMRFLNKRKVNAGNNEEDVVITPID